MKVLITIPCLLHGGTEMQTLSLSKVLRYNSLAVKVICYFEYEAAMVKEFQTTGADVILLDMNRNSGGWAVIKRLRKEILQINPDVVHVQYMAPGALPIISARLAGVKTVFATVHQPYTRSHGLMAKLILHFAFLMTSKFIVVSQNAEKSWFRSSSLFNESKPLKLQPRHFTILNAIDIERISKIISEISVIILKSELAIPADITVIGAVSRLRYEKGMDILLEAFELLIRSGENAHLLLVGSGPDEKKLKDTAKSYGLSSRITFFGEAEWERAMQLMSLMDVVVVPSRFEGFGLTAAEAMVMGKPVVAADTSGLKEVVCDGETGILFKVNDIPALKRAMESLIRDTQTRERLGTAGKDRVLAEFSLEIYNRKIEALYNIGS